MEILGLILLGMFVLYFGAGVIVSFVLLPMALFISAIKEDK